MQGEIGVHTECSTVLGSSRPRSMLAGGGVRAGRGGKEPLDAFALQVKADWVQVGEVVTAPEVLTEFGQGRGLWPAVMQSSGVA
ncbi:hypothetical protein ACN26Y_23590 [Micromonospora sp. WMMD558]|uniref:hypothetical protein n=1 Tax=unclassified Micromonospora TaxID=2617518 RepID=UPI0012B45D49|nr:hypothetical protein [Micromonospora sp. WMMC415]QGN48989.1 hypothetical protein GKC29_20605 [Micromonospora sp. WMMC415]